jgi:hypothetical protein
MTNFELLSRRGAGDTGVSSMQYKGTVQGNVVILEEGVHLPEGVRVIVTVEPEGAEEEVSREDLAQRRALIARMRVFGERLKGRHVNLGAAVLEGREELEDRA